MISWAMLINHAMDASSLEKRRHKKVGESMDIPIVLLRLSDKSEKESCFVG